MASINYSYLIIIVYLHTVIWFQVFLSDTNHFWIDLFGTFTGTTTQGQSRPGRNGDEGVLIIP